MTGVSLDSELEVARQAARRAARLCAALSTTDGSPMEKGGDGPVTAADFGSQAVILDTLRGAFPDDGVLAEEGSADLVAAGPEQVARVVDRVAAVLGSPVDAAGVLAAIDHRGGGQSGRIWAVDPIDGTMGFLRGDQYAIAVGLLVHGVPVAGVLACPRLELSGMHGVLLWGGPGIGSFVESLGGGKVRGLSVSAVADPGRARLLGSVETAHGDPTLLEELVERVGIGGGWVRIDSQAKYAAVASGMAEIYVRPRNRPDWRERIWDHAAGVAIVTGARGEVTDLDGLPLDFTTGDRLENNRGVLVTNGHVHEAVLAALAESS